MLVYKFFVIIIDSLYWRWCFSYTDDCANI